MSKQASKTLIGGFVVGAIAILIVAIAAFASLNLFEKRTKYILYFDGSVYGLNIGAPVIFRGVEVGEVIDMYMQFDPRDRSMRIPVLVELGGAHVEIVGAEDQERTLLKYRADPEKLMANFVEMGLRAQLGMQSFVTGQLMVTLEFFPDKPVRYVDTLQKHPEIPTVPTTVQLLQETVRDLPLKKITNALLANLEGMERLVNSPELAESIRNLNTLMVNADNLVQHLDQKVDPLASGMEATVTDARGALSEMRKAIVSSQKTLENANKLISEAKGSSGEVSKMQYEFTTAMREFASAAASFRVFIDYLERHPEMLLQGKQTSIEGE